jgi:hypothetical protein
MASKTVPVPQRYVTAEGLAARLWQAWYHTYDATSGARPPRMNGRVIRGWVRDHALAVPVLTADFAERPQGGGNRPHVYAVPTQSDPIIRALAASKAGPMGQAPDLGPLSDLLIGQAPTRKVAHKAPTTTHKVAPGGGTIRTSVRKVAPPVVL